MAMNNCNEQKMNDNAVNFHSINQEIKTKMFYHDKNMNTRQKSLSEDLNG